MHSPKNVHCWICREPSAEDTTLGSAGYLVCNRCGLLFQGRRPPIEADLTYDDSYFKCYAGGGAYSEDDKQRTYEARRRLRFLSRFISGGRLLEIGSAGGHFLHEARIRGFQVRGIEAVQTMAARSRRRFGLDVIDGTLHHADLGDGEHDAVCAFHVLEHLDDPLPALVKLRASLAATGVLVLEVPNIASLIARQHGDRWFNLQPTHHVAHYSPRSLRAALEASGFVVMHSTTVPAWEYTPPRRLLTKDSLLGIGAVAKASRRWSLGQHPDRHEFLRMVARRAGN